MLNFTTMGCHKLTYWNENEGLRKNKTPLKSGVDYYPFGLSFNQQTRENTHPQNYQYNGKELQTDLDLNWTDYGARMYDASIGRWITVDALADEYHPLSPYVYVANNPIIFIDPDGKRIVYAKGVSVEFKANFAKAVKYLNENGAGGILAGLESSETVYTIGEVEGGSYYDPNTKTIAWDPNTGLVTDEAVILSPTSILNHEADHALRHEQNPEQQKKDGKTEDKDYGNKEEKRVITGSEQETAKKLGEIKEGEVTRKNHNGFLLPTSGPTSTDAGIIVEGTREDKKEDK